jgi:hypothetical protein
LAQQRRETKSHKGSEGSLPSGFPLWTFALLVVNDSRVEATSDLLL